MRPHAAPPAATEPCRRSRRACSTRSSPRTAVSPRCARGSPRTASRSIASRDVTVRADRQQDFDLKVAWSDHATARPGSTPKQLGYLQFFEGLPVARLRLGRTPRARATDEPRDQSAARRRAGRLRCESATTARWRPSCPRSARSAGRPPSRAATPSCASATGSPSARRDPRLHQLPRREHPDVFGGPIPSNEPAALRDLVRWWAVPEPDAMLSGLCALAALGTLKRRRSAAGRRVVRTSSRLRSRTRARSTTPTT